MNVNKVAKKPGDDLNKAIGDGLQEWLEQELPGLIDAEIQSIQAENESETVDED